MFHEGGGYGRRTGGSACSIEGRNGSGRNRTWCWIGRYRGGSECWIRIHSHATFVFKSEVLVIIVEIGRLCRWHRTGHGCR